MNRYLNYSNTNDIKTNYDKIVEIVENFYKNELDADWNFRFYPNRPKMSGKQVIALSLCAEAMGIDSENYFLYKISNDYGPRFPSTHIMRFNKRRKVLAGKTSELAGRLGWQLSGGEVYFIADSKPVPVCKLSKEQRTKVYRQNFETACNKGYSAFDGHYIGYKLHLVTSLDGVYRQMDITKASVHYVGFPKDIKNGGQIRGATLLGDTRYPSAPCQINLFESVQVRLKTPMGSNQKDFVPQSYIFKKCRKRTENIFSQLCDQFMLKRNYAKTFAGLGTRIITKITGLTLMQFINKQNGRPINNIKHALAF